MDNPETTNDKTPETTSGTDAGTDPGLAAQTPQDPPQDPLQERTTGEEHQPDPAAVTSFQERVRMEAIELATRIEKLDAYRMSDAYQALPDDADRILLNVQSEQMKAYLSTLNARIARFA